MPGRWVYDFLYRKRAPWEGGARSELVALTQSGILDPASHPRAVDLGCGAGANSIFLAEHGFDVTGIDFSPVALRRARQDAAARGASVRFVEGDLTAPESLDVNPPFDLLIDYGTLDDLRPTGRKQMASTVDRFSRPGSLFLLWCFYGARRDLPLIRFDGPSKLSGAIAPGEVERLFGRAFNIERLADPPASSRFACFLMTKR